MNHKHIFYNIRVTTTLMSADLRSVFSRVYLKKSDMSSFAITQKTFFFFSYIANILKTVI